MTETTNDLVDTTPVPGDQVTDTSTSETPADATAPTDTTPHPEQDGFASKAVQKRIAQLTFQREQAKREAAAARAMLEAKLSGTSADKPQDFQAEVNKTAAHMRAEESFNEASNRTFEKGVADFPDFKTAVQAFDLIGGLHDHRGFIEAINSLPNGHAVFHHLGKNLDAASDILEIKSPVQMAVKLAELSGSLAKPKKQISNAPTPPTPISGGAASSGSKDPNKMSMAEYMEWRKAH